MSIPEEYQTRIRKLENSFEELQKEVQSNRNEGENRVQELVRLSKETLALSEKRHVVNPERFNTLSTNIGTIVSRVDRVETTREAYTAQIDQIEDSITQLRTEVKNIPHFDWKWFFGIIVPITFFIIVVSVQ